jgi:hypothetical protein
LRSGTVAYFSLLSEAVLEANRSVCYLFAKWE